MNGAVYVLELKRFGVAIGYNIVLSDCNLTLPASGVDVLMGPVKTGKSTLLRTLAGHFEGHALHRCWGQALMQERQVGGIWRPALVAQHAKSANLSLLDALRAPRLAVAGPNPQHWRQWASDALQKHGLGALVSALDHKVLDLDTVSQRCVLVLAQALTQPALLMVDEPTYGLSEVEAMRIIWWLRNLGHHQRLLVVLHHQQQARALADRVILIGGGRVLAHLESEKFFRSTGDQYIEQFLRTGGLDLPSPNADPACLEAGVPAPPPLPREALQALGLSQEAAAAGESPGSQGDVSSSSSKRVTVLPSEQVLSATAPAPPMRILAKAETVKPIAVDPREKKGALTQSFRRPAQLPSPLPNGVELANRVGQVVLGTSRGPDGFRWVVPGMLAGCALPGGVAPLEYDLDLLKRMGVTHLITLTEHDLEQEALKRFDLTNTHLPVFDREAPSINQVHMLLVRMRRLLEKGEVLAVHCKAGVGRTGVVLAAWLIYEGGLTAKEAVKRLRIINPSYVQSKQQEDFLIEFENDLTRRLE